MNSIGPKQQPWGTPVATSKSRDCLCSTRKRCFRPDRNDLIHKRAWLVTPKSLSSRAAMVSSSTVSKAALKYFRTGRVTSCLSILERISLWTLIKAVLVEWNWRYGVWFVGRGACSLQWLRSCEITAFSAIFDTNERLLTGRKFSNTGSISSFLISGMTSAIFQLLGVQLPSNEKLIILAMIGVTVSTHFLTSQVGIGSRWQLTSDDDRMILRTASSDAFFRNFRATFWCIVKQLLLDLLAQSIHAYRLQAHSTNFRFCLFSFGSFWQGYRNRVSHLLRSRNKSLPPWEMKASHNNGNSVPYSFRTVCGFFYVPQSCEHWRAARRGLRFIVLIRED